MSQPQRAELSDEKATNPYAPPEDPSIPVVRIEGPTVMRTIAGLFFGFVAGAIGFFSTCGATGFVGISVVGIYSEGAGLVLVAAFAVGAIVAVFLFFRVLNNFLTHAEIRTREEDSEVRSTPAAREKSP